MCVFGSVLLLCEKLAALFECSALKFFDLFVSWNCPADFAFVIDCDEVFDNRFIEHRLDDNLSPEGMVEACVFFVPANRDGCAEVSDLDFVCVFVAHASQSVPISI